MFAPTNALFFGPALPIEMTLMAVPMLSPLSTMVDPNAAAVLSAADPSVSSILLTDFMLSPDETHSSARVQWVIGVLSSVLRILVSCNDQHTNCQRLLEMSPCSVH